MDKTYLSAEKLFGFLIAAGLSGICFRQIGVWLDDGDYSVLGIMTGGAPEFGWRSVTAIFAYGAAISCLGVMLAVLGLMKKAAGPRTSTEQFRRFGMIMILGTVIFWGGLLGSIILCIWNLIAFFN